MKPFTYALALGLATAQLVLPARAADITGAGAAFPFPVYSKWAEAYRKETGNGLHRPALREHPIDRQSTGNSRA